MRDHPRAVAAHRARFVLQRRAVPPVTRVLLAARTPVVVGRGTRNALSLHLRAAITVSRPVPPAVSAAPPAPVGRPAVPSVVVGAPVVVRDWAAARRVDGLAVLRRLERVESRTEHVVTRTEERIPPVARTVTRTVPGGAAPGRTPPAADGPRPAVPATTVVPAAAPPAPLDLGRITDHVLTAMDDRLSAYAERLGRG